MKQKQKQLLGILGLIAVMVMTAIAYALPTYAVESDSASTTVRLTVTGPAYDLTIISPKDGETLPINTNGNQISLPVKANQAHLTKIEYLMTCVNSEGVETTTMAESTITEKTGDDDIVLTLPAAPGDNNCSLQARGIGNDYETEVVSDLVNFNFRAMSVRFTGNYDEHGNPEVEIIASSETNNVELQVYDKNGRAIFSGDLNLSGSQFEKINDTQIRYTLYLPMSENDAPIGDYTLVSIAYDIDKNVLSMNVNDFTYDPEAAGVPHTGSILKDLNLSRSDFLLTGLVIFMAASGFALYLIFRKKRQA